MSNLGQLITEARGLLYEVQGAPGSEDPLGWVSQAIWATNEMSRRTYALYLEATTDVVSATALYCLPATFYKIRTVQEMQDSGDWVNLYTETTQLVNRQRGAWWQTWTPSDPARFAVINSPGFGVQLAPVPSVSRTAALKITGQWQPDNVWGYTTAGAAIYAVDTSTGLPNLTVENPLPAWAHTHLPAGMAYRRSIVFPTPENRERRPFLKDEWDNGVGQVHGAIMSYSPPAMVGCYYGAGAWGRW